MNNDRPLFMPLVAMTALAIIATMLFVVAAVVWLSGVLGSVILTCLLVGIILALSAIVIYTVRIRERLLHLREQLGTIYEIAEYAKSGYEWAVKWLCNTLKG